MASSSPATQLDGDAGPRLKAESDPVPQIPMAEDSEDGNEYGNDDGDGSLADKTGESALDGQRMASAFDGSSSSSVQVLSANPVFRTMREMASPADSPRPDGWSGLVPPSGGFAAGGKVVAKGTESGTSCEGLSSLNVVTIVSNLLAEDH